MVKWIICALALVAVAYGRPSSDSNSPSTQQQFRPRIDCPRLGDGNYVFGCSSTFYQCANGVAHAQKCHSEMVLDPESNACDTPAKVAICRPEAMQNPTVVRAKDPFTCVGRPVGMYFISCNGAYAYCDGQGNRRDRSCPPGTALDESRGACDWPQNVASCNGGAGNKQSRRNTGNAPTLPLNQQLPAGAPGYSPKGPVLQDPPALPAPQRPKQPYSGSQLTAPILPRPTAGEPLIPAQPTADDAPEFDCSTRKNGIYPSPIAGCVNFFWKCNNGQAFKYLCPEGLVFSVSHVECRRVDEITDCNVQQSAPLNPTEPLEWKPTLPQGQQIMGSQQSSLAQQTLGPYAQPQPQQPIQQTPPRPTENWCQQNNRQDGYFGEACSAHYFHCNAGFTTRMLCPAGLFFDAETEACDHRNLIVACGGQRPIIPPTQQPIQQSPPRPLENWCQQNNRQDGYFGEACSAHYFHCSAGFTTRMLCPSGLFFDAETESCDHRNLIVACGGQKPTQPPAQSPTLAPQQPISPYGQRPVVAPQQPIQQDPPRMIETWCQQNNRQDGYHGEGCSAHYFYCSLGSTTRLQCPSGLFFDAETEACDHRNLIVACGGQKPIIPPTQQPIQQSPPRPAETWCQQNNRQDGYFGEGCSAYYFHCNAGFTTRMLCPSGLFFDEETQSCDHRTLIVACGGQKSTQPPAQSPTLAPQRPLAPYGQQPIQQNPPMSSLGDHGNFNNYLQPQPQQPATLPPQQPTLAPQQPLGAYGYKPQPIPQATQPPQLAQAPPALPQTRGPYAQPQPQPQPQQPIQQTPPRPLENWCQQNNRQDGYFGEACSAHYFHCSAGFTTRMLCPSGLFFDAETQSCDHRNLIVACGGQRPTQPPAQSPTLAPQQPISPYGQQPIQQSPPRPAETWCQQNNRQDGYHGEGCSAHYFYCSLGSTTRLQCPAGLFFDDETRTCDHRNLIVACGGQRPTQPPAQSPTLPPQQLPIENFCQLNNLANGLHSDGCNQHFFVCAAGSTTRINCPANLWYDIEIEQCDRREFVAACGGQRPTLPPQSPTLPPQPIQPLPLFDCSGKADGIYVEGCSAQYFACNGGHAHALSCPAGTFYSTHIEGCDYRGHIVACGGQAPTQAPPAQNPILLPQQPYSQPQQPQQPQQLPAIVPQVPATPAPVWVAQPYQPAALPQQSPPVGQPTQVQSVNTNPCLSLTNGIYGRKCSRFFFVCTNSKTYDFICPKDQAFNVQTSKCTPKTVISTCPEFIQVPQQSPPVSQAVSPYGRRLY